MMRATALAIGMLMIGSAAPAQTTRPTSAYTALNLDRCTALDRVPEPASARWRCTGYGGIALFVQDGDDRFDVDAGREDQDELWSQSFDYPGKTVEWRLLRGQPFAIIYRLNSTSSEAPRWSRLMVETIGHSAPGCRIASIDARGRGANAQARKAADETLRGKVQCLTSTSGD